MIEYKAEVSAGDVLDIRAYLIQIGITSFTAHCEMMNLAKREIAATLESVCVLFDLEARKVILLSDEMTSKAKNCLET